MKYKIDMNIYESDTFPYALYRRGRKFGFLHWDHVRSHRTREDARADYERLREVEKGMPEYLGDHQ